MSSGRPATNSTSPWSTFPIQTRGVTAYQGLFFVGLPFRQGLLVEVSALGQDSVQIQDIGDNRIGVVDAERARSLIGHGPTDVIEQGRRIGPEAAYGLTTGDCCAGR